MIANAPTGPTGPAWPEIGFEDRMGLTDFVVGERPHITVDGDACRGCTTKACVVACPANLFVPTADGGILFNYEQCFECGTCYMVCNTRAPSSGPIPTGDTASCSTGADMPDPTCPTC